MGKHPIVWGAAAALVAVVIVYAAPGASSQETPQALCTGECPPGSRKVSVQLEDVTVQDGAFVWYDSGCETLCEAEQACVLPDVPAFSIDESGQPVYSCQPLAGYSEFPQHVETDTSFGKAWDPALVTP